MKSRTLVISSIALAVVAAIGFYVAHVLGLFTSPPVIIIGGSIHGRIDKGLESGVAPGWHQQIKGQLYSFAATNNTSIYVKGVYDAGTTTATSSMPTVSGFVISYYDSLPPDGDTGQPAPGVKICSDQACQGNAGDGVTVYMEISRQNAELEEKSVLFWIRELHFHSLDNGCDKHGSGAEGACDRIHHISIKLGPGGTDTSYDCGVANTTGHGHCNIGIGADPPNP